LQRLAFAGVQGRSPWPSFLRRLITGPGGDLARLPVQLNLRAISLAEGLRAGLSVALIIAAAEWLARPLLMEAALGALLTCLCDAGGPVHRRLPALLSFALIGTLFTCAFPALRIIGLPGAILLATIGIFGTSLARIWGPSAMQVGNLLTVVLLVAVARPAALPQAARLAGMFLGGSVWALLLTLVIWRLHPYAPARRAVGEAFRRLGVLAGDLRVLLRRQASAADWETHARAHRRQVRDAIETARGAVLDTVRVRGPLSGPAAQSLIRLEAVDQLFEALVALSDLLEQTRDPAVRAAADRLLRLLRVLLFVLGRATAADRTLPPQRMLQAITAIDLSCAGAAALARIGDAITERLRIFVTLAAPDSVLPGGSPAPVEPTLRDRFANGLRANRSFDSPALRHALRAAVLAAPALVFTLHWYHGYEHWLTITLVLTMQPFFALTWQRAVERIVGTLLGGILAAILAMLCTTPLAIAAALFPLTIATFAVRQVSFGAFITLITPLVILLTELGRPGTAELTIAAMRTLYTLTGGLIAVIGCLVLWPSWEPDRLRRELDNAVATHAEYARTVLDGADPVAVQAARRAAGVASNALETSLSRALLEPTLTDVQQRRDRLEAAMVVDAALRRLAGRLSALQLAGEWRAGLAPAAWQAWSDWVRTAMARLAQRLPVDAPRPEGRPDEALARVARQIELMDGALRRFR